MPDRTPCGRVGQPTVAEEIVAWLGRSGSDLRTVNRSELAQLLCRPGSSVRTAFRTLIADGTITELPGRNWRPGGPVDPPLYQLTPKTIRKG